MKSLPKNYLLALIIFIGVLTWIASGFFKSETMDNSLEINSEIVEEKIAVRAKDIYGEDKTYFLTVRGRTEFNLSIYNIWSILFCYSDSEKRGETVE